LVTRLVQVGQSWLQAQSHMSRTAANNRC